MTIYPLPPQELDDNTLNAQIEAIAQTLCDIHWLELDKRYQCGSKKDFMELTAAVNAHTTPLLPKDPFEPNAYVVWGFKCLTNYLKLVEMGLACCEEWIYRFSDARELAKGMSTRQLVVHEMEDVILWAQDNVPDLPSNTTCACFEKDCPLETATPFPLVMPEGLIAMYHWYPEDKRDSDPCSIEQSYRNYYYAKLQERINTPVKVGEICDKYYPKWTRRETPSFLKELLASV